MKTQPFFMRGLMTIVGAAAWCLPAAATELTLDAFLDQVKSKNGVWSAAQLAEQASRRQALESGLLTSPSLFAEVQHADDHSPQVEVALYGDRRQQDQYRLGIQGQTDWGMSGRLGHETFRYQIAGANPLYLPVSDYFTTRTFLELKQDLWRNGLGRELRDTQTAIEARAESNALQNAFQARQMLVQAEAVYWRLTLAREVVRIQQNLLDRALQLEQWTAGRVRLKLMDNSDLMQAQSQVQSRRLELANSQDQERTVLQVFNTLRGVASSTAVEGLARPGDQELAAPVLAEVAPVRLDIRSLEAASRASHSNAGLKQQQLQPELQAVLGLAWNGLDAEFDNAFQDACDNRYYAYAVGLNLTVPLDFWTTRGRVSKGYDLEAAAADQLLEQRRLESQSDWQELRRRLADVQCRLAMARELEQLQRKKADNERRRLKRGNTVTFQVLQFEQDWGQSQLARVGVESVMLELLAQVKLYQSEPSERLDHENR